MTDKNPVTLTRADGATRLAYSPADIVNAQYLGYRTPEQVAVAEKAVADKAAGEKAAKAAAEKAAKEKAATTS